MLLTFTDRLGLSTVLPNKEEYVKLMIIDDIEAKIKLSQEDTKLANLRTVEESLQWDSDKVPDKEIEFTEIELQVIKDILKKLNDEKELQRFMKDTYKKFNT